MRYVEFCKRIVPLHDDLFQFFYDAMPGYEEAAGAGCCSVLGRLQRPGALRLQLPQHDQLGPKMFVTPGVVGDGKLVTNDLVKINLGLRILLGSSFYEDWDGQEIFVDKDPLGNPIDRRHPWNQHTIPATGQARLLRCVQLDDVASVVRR